ncbi:MAG: winged helix-turn-helix domain-containing protein [Thermoanaerobaculia bacterium]
MRPRGAAAVLEARRHWALKLLDEGRSLHEVGRLVGCAPVSVMRWRNARDEGGAVALQVRFSPGRPPKLNGRQRQRLVKLLLKGAMVQGYRTEIWTTSRVAALIRKTFGVRYHRDHVGRLLHALGFTHQKPERRALERNEEAIERWKREEWPRIKKKPRGWVPTSSSSTSRAFS